MTMAGLPHEIFVSGADESVVFYTPGQPENYVEALSRLKFDAAFDELRAAGAVGAADFVLLSADTVVYAPYADEVLGKPHDRADACRMLRLLSGGEHFVITGFTAGTKERQITSHVATKVIFRALSEAEIDHYIDTASPYDKAGAYGIQEQASVFVERIEGDYFNIVGLPVERVYLTLREICES